MKSAYLSRSGNFISSKVIGKILRTRRKETGFTLKDLALTSGTGIRFLVDLEKGKKTCQLEKTLMVIQTLGLKIIITHRHDPMFEERAINK